MKGSVKLSSMSLSVNTYIPRNSAIHAMDARIKLVLLFVFSITTFMVTTWAGLAILFAILLLVLGISRLPIKHIFALCCPLFVILAIIWLCNAFVLDVTNPSISQAVGGISVGFAQGMPNIALVGTFGFSPEGAIGGAFYVVRIIALFIASFVVVLSSTSNNLVSAISSLLRPLKNIRIPVDDIAMIFSLVLRFIPLIATEAAQIKTAQMARGAAFNQGGAWRRVSSWFPVLIPLFVGLFRKAEQTSMVMDARCYGKGPRTNLVTQKITAFSWLVLIGCSAVFIVVGIFL